MPSLCALLPLLADAAPPAAFDPASYQSMGWLLLAMAALAGAVNQVMGVMAQLKALKRPDPGTVSQDRVAGLENRMHAMELKMENHLGAINSKFEAISSTLTNLQSDWNYAIGKIDGRNEVGPGKF